MLNEFGDCALPVKAECRFCGTGGCTLECTELLEFAGHRQQFVAFLPHDGDMRRGYHLRTDGTPSPKAFIYSYHKSYFRERTKPLSTQSTHWK